MTGDEAVLKAGGKPESVASPTVRIYTLPVMEFADLKEHFGEPYRSPEFGNGGKGLTLFFEIGEHEVVISADKHGPYGYEKILAVVAPMKF